MGGAGGLYVDNVRIYSQTLVLIFFVSEEVFSVEDRALTEVSLIFLLLT